MQSVVTLIGPAPGSLSTAATSAAAAVLKGLGAEEVSVDWLAEGEAADILFTRLNPDLANAAVRPALHAQSIDCIAQPADGRRKQLLVADMESTMIQQEMLDEIAELKGLKPQIAAITARAMNGEIDFVGALEERVALLAGLSEREIDALSSRITLMPGAEALVATMRRNHARAILVSGGFTLFADRVATVLGFDFVSANVLEFAGPPGERVLTGRVVPPIRDRTDKLDQFNSSGGAVTHPAQRDDRRR